MIEIDTFFLHLAAYQKYVMLKTIEGYQLINSEVSSSSFQDCQEHFVAESAANNDDSITLIAFRLKRKTATIAGEHAT